MKVLLTALAALTSLGLAVRAQGGVLAPPDAGAPRARDAGIDDAELAKNLELLRELELLQDLDLVSPAPDGGEEAP